MYHSQQIIIYDDDNDVVILEANSAELKRVLKDFEIIMFTNHPDWMFIGKYKDEKRYAALNVISKDGEFEIQLTEAEPSDPERVLYFDHKVYFDPANFWKIGGFKYGFRVLWNFGIDNKKRLSKFK